MTIIEPHSELPKPEAPAGLFALPPPPSSNYSFKLGKFIRERSNNFSAAIAKKLNSLDDARAEAEAEPAASTMIKPDEVTQFNISGLSLSLYSKNLIWSCRSQRGQLVCLRCLLLLRQVITHSN